MFTSQRIHKKNRQRRKKKIFFFFFVGVLLGTGGMLFSKIQARFYIWQAGKRLEQMQEELKGVPEESFKIPPSLGESDTATDFSLTEQFQKKLEELSFSDIPSEKILAVPFICQNPFQDASGWDFHKESCEEAALLQSYLYTSGEQVSRTQADEALRSMISWQKQSENFGAHIDLYGDDMKRFIEGYYDLPEDAVVHIENIDRESIRKVITLGYPLIVPIKGELLNNPFYPYPGYHMLTVIGYSQNAVITNDVGTKRGEKYPYEWEVFLDANTPVGNDAFVILKVQ